ncbi:hypothetical protein [Mucilaginibacter sp. OK268]|uniref:hypothetical protein n=1 Tax=Mucilaginibacter sp. OK268 TaxID=1881048 RepID=UPI00115FD206|nr:hypothetical protein [Mucilaginibacter sp. OK268]
MSKYTESLTKLNTKNQEFISTGDKVDEKVSKASNSFASWLSVINLFVDVIKGWQVALTGGLSIVVAFLPEIINFAKALFMGKDATNAMALNFKNLNDVMKDSNKEASSEITRLQILYKSATDVNNGYSDRIKSVKELKKEFPEHLKAISDESILNGNAKKSYDELTKSIFENARARAAEAKIEKLSAQILDLDLKKEKINNAKAHELANTGTVSDNFSAQGGGRGATFGSLRKAIKDRANLAQAQADQDKKILKDQIDFLVKFAGGNNKIAKMMAQDNNTEIATPTKLKKASVKKTTQTRSSDLLEAKSITFAKQIELDKQHYDIELSLLNDQLSKKLISQDDYNKQAEQLQEKFHLAIGDKIQFFNKNDFDEAKKHMQDMIEHNDVMAKDQKNVDKAILPGQKLDAEKQLITDKYNYEIKLAAGNADKIKELEIQKQEAITQLTKQYEQQRNEFIQQTAQQVSNAAFSILQNNIKNQSDAKIKGLEKDKAAELSNKSLTSTQRQAIEAKYQKQEAAEKVKAFKSEQKASILQAVINGALAVTKATSQTGILAPFVIPGIIAATAIQVATIAVQKPPQYAKGGLHYQSDGRGALLPGYSRNDNTNAYLRSGEAIVVSEAMRNPWARNLVSAINVAHGGRDFSMPNTSRGYAIGGIFTDGGNANRYYNQPVNDVKELANTLAYQMINNFPPVYVDVKDINNQQNILAQTVNRVNL